MSGVQALHGLIPGAVITLWYRRITTPAQSSHES
jgi:hypothetical protein